MTNNGFGLAQFPDYDKYRSHEQYIIRIFLPHCDPAQLKIQPELNKMPKVTTEGETTEERRGEKMMI